MADFEFSEEQQKAIVEAKNSVAVGELLDSWFPALTFEPEPEPEKPELDDSRVMCAMEAYAAYYGDWSEYHESFKWVSLIDAADNCGYEPQGAAHRALTDCLMTLAVMRAMAKRKK